MSLRKASGARRSVWLLTLVFLLSLPAVTARFYASDEVEYYSWLHSWWFDRDVDFQNQYEHFYETAVHDPGFHETFLERTTETGRRINFAPVGCAILWAPFFAAGDGAARLSGAPTDGYSAPYIHAVTYGSAIYGFLAILLTAALVRRLVGGGLPAAVTVWVGTPLLFYMYVAPGFAHACSAFAVSLFLWLWLRVRTRWTPGGVALLALAGAIMAMVREQDLFFVAGPALDFARTWIGAGSVPVDQGASPASPRISFARGVGLAALAGVVFLAGYAPQLAGYKALNGHFGPTHAAIAKMTWTAPHFFQVLVSPEHGLFFWTPLAFIGALGLAWLALGKGPVASADVRWIACLALVMFGLQVYITGSVESWTVAGSFGQRRFVALTPLIALGLAALAPAAVAGWRRAAAVAVVAVCVWWNLGLMAQFGLHTMDRQRLTLAANAHATFVTLPLEAPTIAWRYLFARSTLFGLPRQ